MPPLSNPCLHLSSLQASPLGICSSALAELCACERLATVRVTAELELGHARAIARPSSVLAEAVPVGAMGTEAKLVRALAVLVVALAAIRI